MFQNFRATKDNAEYRGFKIRCAIKSVFSCYRELFESFLASRMDEDFGVDFKDVVIMTPLIYGDFLNMDSDPRPYVLIDDHSTVR